MLTKSSNISKIMWLIGPILLWAFVQMLFGLLATENRNSITVVNTLGTLVVSIPMWLKMRREYVNKYIHITMPSASVLFSIILFFSINAIIGLLFLVIDIHSVFPSYKSHIELITNASVPVFIIFTGILTPIGEEFLIRGVVLNRALKWMKPWVAILISSGIFGILHMNLFQSIYAFLLGVLFGWIYVKFRSIIVPIAGHMSFNLSNIALDYLVGDKITLNEQGLASFQDIVVLLVPSILVALICIVILNIFPKAKFNEASKYDKPTVIDP